jgi:hypothetical protein
VSGGPTPSQVLAVARSIARQRTGDWGGSWPRACAFLTRQALEDGIGLVWVGDLRPLADCPFRQQLLCLPTYLADAALARNISSAWHGLSAACHAHPYELAPSLGELEQWMGVTGNLLAHLVSDGALNSPR